MQQLPKAISRSGFSLRELLVSMTITGIMLSMFGAIIFRLYRQQASLTVSAYQSGVWLKMARTFRSDIHAADRVTIDNQRLAIASDKTRTSWAYDKNALVRTSGIDGAESHERFVLPQCNVEFLQESVGTGQLIRLVAVAKDEQAAREPLLLTGVVEAAVGIEH